MTGNAILLLSKLPNTFRYKASPRGDLFNDSNPLSSSLISLNLIKQNEYFHPLNITMFLQSQLYLLPTHLVQIQYL